MAQREGEFSFYMRGQWVDVSRDVVTADWNHGGRRLNIFGTVMPASGATITLRNRDGRYNALRGAQNIDLSIGVPVRINLDGVRQFTGWIETVNRQWFAISKRRTVVITCISSMKRLEAYFDRLYLSLPNPGGTIKTGAVMQLILDNVGWTRGRVGQFVDPISSIDAGETNLNVDRVNLSGKLGLTGFAGGRRVQVVDAMKAVSLAEFGLVYGNRFGTIVFEDRVRRSDIVGRPLYDTRALTFKSLVPGIAPTGVINTISTTADAFRSEGPIGVDEDSPLPMTTGGVAVTFPYTFRVPPTGRAGYGPTLRWDTTGEKRAGFISGWTTPVTYTAGDVDVAAFGDFIEYRFTNLTGQPADAVIGQPSGTVFRAQVELSRGHVDNLSVAEYGPRAANFPVDLVDVSEFLDENEENLRDYLHNIIHRHKGIDNDGNADSSIIQQVQMTFDLRHANNTVLLAADISDVLAVFSPEDGYDGETFWIDSVKVQYADAGHNVTMTVWAMDTRATAMWPIGNWDFGRNTVVGL